MIDALSTAGEELEEYDSPDDFLDEVAQEYDPASEAEPWMPTEYVVFYTGPRGSSKTIQLARHSLLGLAQGLKVFTNLELYPEKAGIKTMPLPVNLEFLLSFDESLEDAVIVISEIDTWFDYMRATATGNRLGGKFMQQLRKKGLRVFFDTQDYLPGNLMKQVDKLVFCHDFFFTDWGRERGLRKGTTFYYDCMDYSGNFTGRRGRVWREALYHAEKVWPLFNTHQIHDPFGFASRIKITGVDKVLDRKTGEIYDPTEKEQREWEQNIAAFSVQAKRIIDAYEDSGFLELARRFKAVREFPSLYRFSCPKLGQMIANLDTAGRLEAQVIFEELRTLAAQHGMARYHPNKNYIELAKPVILEQTEET